MVTQKSNGNIRDNDKFGTPSYNRYLIINQDNYKTSGNP